MHLVNVTTRATLALLTAVAVACSKQTLPAARLSASEATIRSARDIGAEQVPEAAAHLELAQHQVARARQSIDDGDHDKARWLLLRADADAQLAKSLTEEARTRRIAEEMAAHVRDLSGQSHAGATEVRPSGGEEPR